MHSFLPSVFLSFFPIPPSSQNAISLSTEWMEHGKLKWRETVVDGIEKLPEAFISLMEGGNIGKQLVKVSD